MALIYSIYEYSWLIFGIFGSMWVLEQYSTCGACLTSSRAVFCKIVLQHYMFMLCLRTRAFFVAGLFCCPFLSETTIELKTPCQGWWVLFVNILTIMFGANHPYLVSHLLLNFGRGKWSSVGLPLTRNHAHNLKLSRFIRSTNFPNQLPHFPLPPKKTQKSQFPHLEINDLFHTTSNTFQWFHQSTGHST